MRLLDLFCCEGGAARGYAQAGFEVVGVDVIDRARRYPYEFVQADALEVLKDPGFVDDFDVIHASPPCQGYSITRHSHSVEHPQLVEPLRELLDATGLPYVIENVPGAPLRDPLMLCGTMFALGALDDDGEPLFLRRHRLFESNVPLLAPDRCWCAKLKADGYRCAGVYGGARRDLRLDPAARREAARTERRGGYVPSRRVQQDLLGVDWMTEAGMAQSIPPAYTRHIGAQLLGAHVEHQLTLF